MARIASYVFLDLETTSLPHLELNKTKITELSMIVVKRNHILDTKVGVLPRVQHKLTMCFNPGRIISPDATDTSGLDNDLLEHETMFNMEVFNTINSFLNCQEKPVCLIAENGIGFDFPILKNHFVKLNVNLNEDVMCADSLYAFYDIFKEQLSREIDVPNNGDNVLCNGASNEHIQTEPKAVPVENNNKKLIHTSTQIGAADELLILKNGSEEIAHTPTHIETLDELLLNDTVDKGVNTQLAMQIHNERTPSSKKIKITAIKTLKGVKRRIFFEGDAKPKESYKLAKIYERVLGRSGIEAHRAENDCIMAAELSTSKAKEFVEWVDNNHCAFSEVKPMRLGVRLGD